MEEKDELRCSWKISDECGGKKIGLCLNSLNVFQAFFIMISCVNIENKT